MNEWCVCGGGGVDSLGNIVRTIFKKEVYVAFKLNNQTYQHQTKVQLRLRSLDILTT